MTLPTCAVPELPALEGGAHPCRRPAISPHHRPDAEREHGRREQRPAERRQHRAGVSRLGDFHQRLSETRGRLIGDLCGGLVQIRIDVGVQDAEGRLAVDLYQVSAVHHRPADDRRTTLGEQSVETLADRLDALRGARAGHRGAQRDDRAICDDEIRRQAAGRGRIGVRSGRLCRRRRGREQQEPRRQRAGTPARTRHPTDRTVPPAPLVHADRTSGRQPTVRHDDTATSTAASGSHHAGRL